MSIAEITTSYLIRRALLFGCLTLGLTGCKTTPSDADKLQALENKYQGVKSCREALRFEMRNLNASEKALLEAQREAMQATLAALPASVRRGELPTGSDASQQELTSDNFFRRRADQIEAERASIRQRFETATKQQKVIEAKLEKWRRRFDLGLDLE